MPAHANEDPRAEGDELQIFEEDPPAQRLREVHAEASAVLNGFTPCEGTERERGPGERDRECRGSAQYLRRGATTQKESAAARLADDQTDSDDPGQRRGADVVVTQNVDESREVSKLTGCHREQ